MTIDTTGDEEADSSSASQAQRSLDTQVGDLRDARADAVANMEKSQGLVGCYNRKKK